ncbi:hypothetical protein [Hydrogenophaga sp.]|uniref:hypothetical protein n=1 Tax=Hydrogenophaga sp. TaxID=1904254 RepID=UPI0025C684C0|nr:hypothetical protein [Hydrogenophaga sp.]
MQFGFIGQFVADRRQIIFGIWRQIDCACRLRDRFLHCSNCLRAVESGFCPFEFGLETQGQRVVRHGETPDAQPLLAVVHTELADPCMIAVLQAQYRPQGPFTPAGIGPAGLPAQQPLGRQHQHAGREIQFRIEVNLQPA